VSELDGGAGSVSVGPMAISPELNPSLSAGPAAARPTGWVAPAASLLSGVGAVAYVGRLGGGLPNVIPPCGFHWLTGWWCPGCGLTRGTRALLHGHLQQALGYNLFTPLVLTLMAYSWLTWALPAVGGPQVPHMTDLPRKYWHALGALVFVFSIARNLPIAPLAALAP
jgi:Protein of unknown function (DUF2752)